MVLHSARIEHSLKWQDVWVQEKHLPDMFWREAVICANYVLNCCPKKALRIITPYEAWNE